MHYYDRELFEALKSSEPKYKFPKTIKDCESMRDTAIRRVCGNHSLTLAREIQWAHEAVDHVGLDNFTALPWPSDLEKLKLDLWDSKTARYICIEKIRFKGFGGVNYALPDDMLEKFDQQDKKLTAKIVAHIMLHGNDQPDVEGIVNAANKNGQTVEYNSSPTIKDFSKIIRRL